MSWQRQWELALHRLETLRTAELVHTSRLHVALPCLAFGTPVVLRRKVRDSAFQPQRFSLLDELGFEFDRPCVLNVSAAAARFTGFLAKHLVRAITPGPYRSVTTGHDSDAGGCGR